MRSGVRNRRLNWYDKGRITPACYHASISRLYVFVARTRTTIPKRLRIADIAQSGEAIKEYLELGCLLSPNSHDRLLLLLKIKRKYARLSHSPNHNSTCNTDGQVSGLWLCIFLCPWHLTKMMMCMSHDSGLLISSELSNL
jgi:hypothetical protein